MAADEWRSCVDWLVRCQILPSDHKATKPDATAFDLAQALRDGALLCHLLNSLRPGCIDMKEFSPRPQMSQFLCMKNIRAFLTACANTFGLSHDHLFKPNDLFDVKDFRKVLDTLSTLSKTDVAQHRVSGFPPDSGSDINDQVEDIYGNLKDLALENDLEDHEDIYDTVYQEEDEKIYDDLLGGSKKLASVTNEAVLTKRNHCIKELLDTENNYKTALKMIIDHFIKPLHNVLPSGDRDLIFAHIEKLYEIHVELNEKLSRSASQGRIAEVFIAFKPRMIIYGDFCSNLPRAQEKIDKICETELNRLKIQECERRANEGKFRLRDLLHVPMQRVLKYHLLLRELIKNTERTNSEREGLEKALEAMQDLSLYVNEVKRDHESLQVIEDIQNSITDLRMPVNTSLKDYGRFQKDGELKVLSHSDNRQRNRHIFLFDKVMLMCKAKGDIYSFKDAIVLGEFRVDESGVIPEKRTEKRERGWNFPFIMVKHDKSTAFTFYAKTADQRDKWREAIALALDNSSPPFGRNFIMYTFEKPTECDVCHKLLRGVFYQGYKCTETDKAVHKECIVKCSTSSPPAAPPRRPAPAVKRTAVKPYKGLPAPPINSKPTLHFNKDDVIDVIGKYDETWWLGKLNGEEGYFPGSFVRGEEYERVPDFPNGVPPRPAPPPGPRRTENLNHYPWYVGEMERGGAQKELDPMPDGTFLIRVTNNPARHGELSLSIKYANAVRHIKVNRGATDGKFYLAEGRYFDSVKDLVDFYQATELADSFPEVCTTLKYPFKKMTSGPRVLGYAVAIYDYAATSTSQVTLQVGDRVAILSKTGQDKGWWKGENLRSKKIGYFPLAYVKDEEEQ